MKRINAIVQAIQRSPTLLDDWVAWTPGTIHSCTHIFLKQMGSDKAEMSAVCTYLSLADRKTKILLSSAHFFLCQSDTEQIVGLNILLRITGWGAAPIPEVQAAPRPKGGRGRGRGGRGRGRGSRGRRGGRSYRRGRSQNLDEELEDSDSENGGYVETELPVPTPSKESALAVEQIYGWRWSLPGEPQLSPL